MTERYTPTKEEIKDAEERMTKKEKIQSFARELAIYFNTEKQQEIDP